MTMRNIEIKARVEDLSAVAGRAAALADTAPEIIEQEDTYFHCPEGRLKLRRFTEETGELIFYERPDASGPRESRYVRSPTAAAATLRTALERAFGIRGVVRKTRTLYLVGATRIHLDEVEDLGSFVEIEVALEPGQGEAAGAAVARDIMDKLGLREDGLEGRSYIDLVEEAAVGADVP